MDLWRVELAYRSGGYVADVLKADVVVYRTPGYCDLATANAAARSWIEAEFRRIAARCLLVYRRSGYLRSLDLAELPDRIRELVFRRVRPRWGGAWPDRYFDRINNVDAPRGFFANDPAGPPAPAKKRGRHA